VGVIARVVARLAAFEEPDELVDRQRLDERVVGAHAYDRIGGIERQSGRKAPQDVVL
jgi:hypothetical protein